MSGDHNIEGTPVVQNPKKRELTSPEFDIEYKKNKTSSEAIVVEPEPDLDSTIMASNRIEDMEAHPVPTMEPHITIPPSEMLKISEMLQGTFRNEIAGLVDTIVKGVVKGLQDQITALEKSNKELKKENTSLSARVTALEAKADQAEQYSRRNCLRISGVKETEQENTDSIVLSLAREIDSDIRPEDIDRSHRIGNPKKKRSKPREIIIKFSTYRARNNFFKRRTLMKERGHVGQFINEDLTKQRSEYLYEARLLVKSKSLKGAWSSDGTILIKDNADRVHRVTSHSDLIPFGYVPRAQNTDPDKRIGPGGEPSGSATVDA